MFKHLIVSFHTLLLFISATAVKAQPPVISVPYPVASQSLTRGLDTTLLTVEVLFPTACNNVSATVAFPASVTYIPGSVASIAPTTSGFSIAEDNISNLSAPAFSIIVPGTGSIRFTVKRIASCGSSSNGKDTIKITSSCGDATENDNSINTYNILAPVLSVLSPTPVTNAVLNQTYTRDIVVTNGGNGCLDTLRFYTIYPGGGLVNSNSNKITVSGSDFSPWKINGDTLFYKIFGSNVFAGDNLLCNGESITIQEPVKLIRCDASAIYNAYWNRSSEIPVCQDAATTGAVSMATGVANFTIAPITVTTGFTSACNSWTQSATFTNSGTGNAVAAAMYNVKIRMQHSSGGNFGSAQNFVFSAFNVNGHGVLATGTNTTFYLTDFSNIFSSDPDGIGVGLDDLDGDGFYDDLAAGSSFTLVWTTQPLCNLSCGMDYNYTLSYRMIYENMCGVSLTSEHRGGYVPVNELGFGTNSYIPANIIGGVPFRFLFKTGFFVNTNTFFGSNGRYQYRVVLPAGVTIASVPDAKYGIAATSYSLSPGPSGDTLIITSPGNILDTAAINLVYNCGPGGAINFWHSLIKISDITNNCICNGTKYCTTLSSYAYCPSPCMAGPTTFYPTIRRTDGCLGWTDQTLNTRQLASNISAYDLSKALYMDTIQISSGAKQNNAALNIHLRLELSKTTISPINVNKLQPVDVYVEIWRAGSRIYNCSVSGAVDSSTASVQKIDWDLCVPPGGLLAGDSIYSLSKYVVATNAGLPLQDVQSGNNWFYYNKVGTQMEYCNHLVPEMYLVGTSSIIGSNGTNAAGCSSFVPGGNFAYIARRFNSAGQEYQNEFRPMAYIDSIVFTKTNGYDLLSATLRKWAGPISTPLSDLTLTPNYVSGNTYVYINPGSWPLWGVTKTNNYGGAFMPLVSTNCTTQATETFSTKIYVRDYYYAFANAASIPSTYRYIFNQSSQANVAPGTGWNYTLNYATSTKPAVVLQNTTGVVQGVQTNQYWDLKISNPSTYTSPHIWLSVEKGTGTGSIIIDSVVNPVSHHALVNEGAYNCAGRMGYGWYKISSAGLLSGTDSTIRVYFHYNSCSLDSVLVRAGWNCSSFPTNPCVLSCSAEETYLKIDPQISQVQLAMLRQPGDGNSTSMCNTDSVTFVINSAQAANLVNPYVTIYPPAGVNLVMPFSVEYPYESGNWYSATPSAIPGGYKLDLSTVSPLAANGLPGTILNPGYEARQAKIKVEYNTSCNVVSGNPFYFYGFGFRPCGQPATDNSKAVQTGGVFITGATVPGVVGLSIDLPVTTFDCGQTSTINLKAITVGSPSQTGDTVTYTIPKGLLYLPNSFTGIYNCSSCSVSTDTSAFGELLLKVKLQTGVAADDSLKYSIQLAPDGAGCGNVNITASAKRTISGLMCGATTCTGSSMIVGTIVNGPITINKPAPNITNVKYLSGAWVPGGTGNVAVTISNAGTLNMAANSYQVDFFCTSSASPFASTMFPSAIPMGTTVTANISFPISGSCALKDLITAKIRPYTGSIVAQCLCDSSNYTMQHILPATLSAFSASENNCKVLVKWKSEIETEGFTYQVQYSNDGVNYETVGTVNAAGNGNVYSYLHSPLKGRAWYRLQMTDAFGESRYSNIVQLNIICNGKSLSVYPNPANAVLNINMAGFSGKINGRLMNSFGQTVLSTTLQNGNNIISSEKIPPGIYSFAVSEDNQVQQIYKVTIQH